MNLRILIYSNPLVVNKISKRFLYDKDSGFLFTRNLLKVLPDDWRYYWLIPDNITEQEKEWFTVQNKIIKLVPYPYSTSIHQNRYEFYGNVLKQEFPYTKDIDAVINNQPEITANISTWLFNQRRDLSPIFNFFHWIDCKESRDFGQELSGYFWREWDGVLNAEKSYFHNSYAKSLFETTVIENIKDPKPYSYGYFSPPSTNYGESPIALPENKKIILFNHRLNNTTNWKFFLEAVKELRSIRDDFVVWFTDDSDKAKSKLLTKEPYIVNKSLSYSQYGYLLKHSHISVCTHKGYSTWNMAILDAINNECFTLVPETERVYKEMFNIIDISMYHDNTISGLVRQMALFLNIEHSVLKEKARKIKQAYPYYFSTNNLEKIKNDIEKAILERVRKANSPLKYDDVREYVSNHNRVTKAELVNTFWSFHVNSNFQKMRWKMLTSGFMDDINEDVPTYRKEVQ